MNFRMKGELGILCVYLDERDEGYIGAKENEQGAIRTHATM